ncbi:MAG: MraY family glycosyltransferase [Saprospiraceae bacterium]|mgnify:CR=1 FL=1|nr:undecaprenyl/decaprenyl-phosphate alpha-N-acetylglucosaminyl 1-phosphate transferase [Saprospiraceae bacterium]MBP7642025.1 undecaprenyl/decaprenyl-phosphate alpha-N-acetylglucosaminyl 1-phosphate transferase [Saprospiraceae bacterium]HMS70418.1 MraY family glycosyltransferase [Saprospiraceae bacterium]
MYEIILAFITSFCLTYVAIPSIIHIARKKNLVDEPGERTSHKVSTPSLGGIAIFAGMLFSIIMWTPFNYFGDLQYILCAFIIIFLIGAKDDLDPISPARKFLGELLAAIILVFKANIMLTSFYGIFGIYDIPYIASVFLSVFTIIVIINAFNLIDGINGLSASIGILISLILGIWFYQIERLEIAIIAFSLIGASFAFLRYNITPAKIFMGDTGSLLLGMVCSILTILFIELHKNMPESAYYFKAAPSFAIAVLILPLFDTLRVFTLRILRGVSPFHPDRNHIHHLLIDSGLSHMQATGVLVVVNILFIFMAFKMQGIGNLNLIILILVSAILLSYGLSTLANKRRKV